MDRSGQCSTGRSVSSKKSPPRPPPKKTSARAARRCEDGTPTRASHRSTPARRARRRHRGQEPVGEEGAAPEGERDAADQPPLQVHDLGAGARGLHELVAEQERPVLRLLRVRGVVVEVVDPVEGAGEGGPGGGSSAARA